MITAHVPITCTVHRTKNSYDIQSRVHKKEKRVSNCTIPAYKHSFHSTKYTCVCLVLHSDLLLSKQLYKSIVDDLRTMKTVFGQLDTLLSFLYTLDTIINIISVWNYNHVTVLTTVFMSTL